MPGPGWGRSRGPDTRPDGKEFFPSDKDAFPDKPSAVPVGRGEATEVTDEMSKELNKTPDDDLIKDFLDDQKKRESPGDDDKQKENDDTREEPKHDEPDSNSCSIDECLDRADSSFREGYDETLNDAAKWLREYDIDIGTSNLQGASDMEVEPEMDMDIGM